MTHFFAARGDRTEIEEGGKFAPKFDENGLLPAIATDAETGEVLMLAWMNEEALARTIATGEAHYWSRSRQELWHKGATSGHVQTVIEIRTDCDQDAIWMKVAMKGPGACHVGYKSCFYRAIPTGTAPSPALELRQCEPDKAFDPASVYKK
jgi:phosphoribosyl-AMP cyclohydrolase